MSFYKRLISRILSLSSLPLISCFPLIVKSVRFSDRPLIVGIISFDLIRILMKLKMMRKFLTQTSFKFILLDSFDKSNLGFKTSLMIKHNFD